MRGQMSVCSLVLAIFLGSCGSTEIVNVDAGEDAALAVDASSSDAGRRDAGRDAGRRDAGRDAGRDSGPPDAGPPDAGPMDAGPPVGECWVVPQGGCAEGEACRARWRGGARETYCEPAGWMEEGCTRTTGGGCYPCLSPDLRDRCQAGLFCQSDQCVRYCDSTDDCVPYEGRMLVCEHIAAEDPLRLGTCGDP